MFTQGRGIRFPALNLGYVPHIDAQPGRRIRRLFHRELNRVVFRFRAGLQPFLGIGMIVAAVQLNPYLHIPFHRAPHVPAQLIAYALDQLEPVVVGLNRVFYLAAVMDVYHQLAVFNSQICLAFAFRVQLPVQRAAEVPVGDQFLSRRLFRLRRSRTGYRRRECQRQQKAKHLAPYVTCLHFPFLPSKKSCFYSFFVRSLQQIQSSIFSTWIYPVIVKTSLTASQTLRSSNPSLSFMAL